MFLAPQGTYIPLVWTKPAEGDQGAMRFEQQLSGLALSFSFCYQILITTKYIINLCTFLKHLIKHGSDVAKREQ